MAIAVRSFRLEGERTLVAETALPAGWRTDEGRRWIDVRGDAHEDLFAWLAAADVNPTLIEEMRRHRHRSGVEQEGDEVVLALGRPRPSPQEATCDEFLLSLPDAIVTIGLRRQMRSDRLFARGRVRLPPGPVRTSILLVIFELVTEELFERTLHLREQADHLAHELQRRRMPLSGETLYQLVQATQGLASHCEERQYVVSSLHLLLAPTEVTVSQHALFDSASRNLDRVVTALDRLEQGLGHLQHQSSELHQRRADQRLRLLSILSSIFLPLSLIAGIYGMNFQHMPELAWPWAYPAVLGLMAGIAATLLVVFWRKGWFSR